MSELIARALTALGFEAASGREYAVFVVFLEWLLLAGIAYLALKIGRWVSRRTESKYDDVLFARMRAPIIVAILIAATADILGLWSDAATGEMVQIALAVGEIFVLVWLAQRLVEDVVLHFAQRRAASTETGLDNMLVPVVKSVVKPVTIGIGSMFALEAVGLPIAGAALLVGGASFVIAFALQSTLEDIFGGLGLIVDTPFTIGDVIKLQDGTLCEVTGLGMRVTRLYSIVDHSTISYSNRRLTQESISNLSRPSPDMSVAVPIQVARHSDTRLVWERLNEAGLAHPWVLGDKAQKLPAMRRRMNRLVRAHDYRRAFKMIKEMQRVVAEGELNDAIEQLSLHVVEAASRVHFFASGGFNQEERRIMAEDVELLTSNTREVKHMLAVWLLAVRYNFVESEACTLSADAEASLHEAVLAAMNEGDGAANQVLKDIHEIVDQEFAAGFARASEYLVSVNDWVNSAMDSEKGEAQICLPGDVPTADVFFFTQPQEEFIRQMGFGAGLADKSNGGIGDLDHTEEYLANFASWNRKMLILEGRMREISAALGMANGLRLDEQLRDLRRWLASDFKEATPAWKYPRAPLVGIHQNLEYELKVYVDNVRLSHFTRAAQVETQLRLDILHLLRDQEPAVELGVFPVD